MQNPNVIILSGPNGAGKSTAAPRLLRGAFAVNEFVNADAIARGLSAFDPGGVALQAGRVMLKRLDELAAARENFAFETTLASRSFAARLEKWIASGYCFRLIHLWIPAPEMSVARVAGRVREGGHHVPSETIHRRYLAGLSNFFELYKPLAFTWRLLDNSSEECDLQLIAKGGLSIETKISIPSIWQPIQKEFDHGK